MSFSPLSRPGVTRAIAAALTITILATPAAGFAQSGHDHAAGTPTAFATPWSCDKSASMGGPMSSTPMAIDGSMNHGDYPFDQLYIDMMIPHHDSIIALAKVALPRLTDPRLIQMAENIIATQSGETAQLASWREVWYGSPTPDTSQHSMMAMLEAMPVGTMDEMMHEMDAATQVAVFCSASDPDLAFIDQVIPHHQMAIDVSEIALERAEHPEIKETAQAVITAQQTEIDELTAIRADLTGDASATPAS